MWTPITIERLCEITGLDPSILPDDCNPEIDEDGKIHIRLRYDPEAFKNMVYSTANTA